VGLNLQSASVLINLDLPWNPAVLEQRIARIHRLGQRDKVQVILMVSSEGYEGRVMQLVQGKQNLFDNVIDPEASEDVVGVSPKLLEKLVEDLTETREGGAAPEEETELVEEPAAAAAEQSKTSTTASPAERAITRCVEELQVAFGARIERILGAGGGLLVVMDVVDEAADRLSTELTARVAEEFEVEVPVALVDPLTLRSLQRLGGASPVQEGELYYTAQSDGGAAESVLLKQAKAHYEAAEVLLEQARHGSALELLNAALLATAAARGGQSRAPTADQAGVWLFSEALPQGWLDQGQAALIMRGLSLAHAAELPDVLMASLLEDSRGFVYAAG
jgi:hypothetical protein